jgi:hypothetical protein
VWKPLALDADRLISEALRGEAHDDFGIPPVETPLRRLVESLNTEAHLTTIGRLSVRQYLLEMLTTRLQLVNAWGRTPAIQAQPLRRPLFITGMARSGTTFLHSLLAQDPTNRVPSIWEVMFPHPPPTREGFAADPRIRKTERRLRAFRWLAPRVQEIHPLSATLAQECIAILSYTFYSDEFLVLYRVPDYEAWLRQQDLLGAYRFHQCFLKHLQWRYRGERWVLKAPNHGFGLDALFQTYPDAGVVRLLRDPFKVLASTASLTAILQGAFSRHPDVDEIGAQVVQALSTLLDRWTQFQARHAELTPQILEVHYLDLIREPLATARRVYKHFGLHLSPGAESRMVDFVSTWEQSRRGNNHRYRLRDFGIERMRNYEFFLTYRDDLGIEAEVV